MISLAQVFLKLNPGVGSNGAFVFVDIIWHLFRISQIDSDTSEDFARSLCMRGLGINELDNNSSPVDQC